MTREMLTDEEITELELRMIRRYDGNPSRTQRAFDEEHIGLLKTLKQAYAERNGPRRKDSFGFFATDAERVKEYQGFLKKLTEERNEWFFSALKDFERY